MRLLESAAAAARIVVFCGIPGVGKSLLLREQLRLAAELGRRVTRLQWDVARQAFETPEILARYPEIDGSTHPLLRRAVGLWVRDAIADWSERRPAAHELLLIEAPLVGARMIELAAVLADRAEPLLAHRDAQFLVPTPTRAVRRAIEAARRAETRAPRHERDAANAPPQLVDALWQQVALAAERLQLPTAEAAADYAPDRYYAVYRSVLRHRHVSRLPIEQVLENVGSPHATSAPSEELAPSADQAPALLAAAEAEGARAAAARAQEWYR
jgi:hypothetical protein